MRERPHCTSDGLPFKVREAATSDAEQLLAGFGAATEKRLDSRITRPEEFAVSVAEEQRWIQEHASAIPAGVMV